MTSRSFRRLLALFAIAVALAACGRTESYRYKLTLAINTPGGVKRASSVVEVVFFPVSIPDRGIMHKLRGQALYLDLGPGEKPLIALLTSQLHPKYGKNVRWSRDGGPTLDIISNGPLSDDFMENISRIAQQRGAHRITPGDLPDLVTFADINDPTTVIEVDRNDLEQTLGPGISWNEIALESTDEPITKGLEQKLPWLPYYWCGTLMLDGSPVSTKKTLANTLQAADFDWSDEAIERARQKTSHGNISYECWKSVAEWQHRR